MFWICPDQRSVETMIVIVLEDESANQSMVSFPKLIVDKLDDATPDGCVFVTRFQRERWIIPGIGRDAVSEGR